jgi:transposase
MAKLNQQQGDELTMLRKNAAGIDLGSKAHYAAIPRVKVLEGESSVKSFSSDLAGVQEMSDWLKSYGIESIAMEATGVYWLSVYEYLDQAGFEVFLVHAQYVKQVAGRKSDVSDSQWIQQLHSYGPSWRRMLAHVAR